MSKDKRTRYDDKMKALGFKKIHPWVHDDDRQNILKLIEDLREKKLKSLDKSR